MESRQRIMSFIVEELEKVVISVHTPQWCTNSQTAYWWSWKIAQDDDVQIVPGGGKTHGFPPLSFQCFRKKYVSYDYIFFFQASLCVSGGQKITLHDKYIMPRKFSNSRWSLKILKKRTFLRIFQPHFELHFFKNSTFSTFPDI